MSNYRLADTHAQWFEDDYPGAPMNLSAATSVVCLHTTESTDWPGYEGGATAPTYTAKPNAVGGLDWRAHFPDEKSARALRNGAGGTETNTLNVVQVELVGTCDPSTATKWERTGLVRGKDFVFWPEASRTLLLALARFLVDQHVRHGLVLAAPDFKPYPASYGTTNGVRFTLAQWRSFVGVCGHQHVPENYHGDPGNLDIDAVLGLAQSLLKARKQVTAPPQPVAEPKWYRKLLRLLKRRQCCEHAQ